MPTQPPRQPSDGRVEVIRVGDTKIGITVVTDNVEQQIVMGEHNAWRILALLALMLGIPMPKSFGKIKM